MLPFWMKNIPCIYKKLVLTSYKNKLTLKNIKKLSAGNLYSPDESQVSAKQFITQFTEHGFFNICEFFQPQQLFGRHRIL